MVMHVCLFVAQTKQTTALEAACEGGYTEIALALLAHPDIDVNGKRRVRFGT